MTDSLDPTWKLSPHAMRERERANAREAERQANREAKREREREERIKSVKVIEAEQEQPAPVPFSVRKQVHGWMQKRMYPSKIKRTKASARGR